MIVAIKSIIKRILSKMGYVRRSAANAWIDLQVNHVSGPLKVDLAEDEVLVACVVRNGAYYLKSFLEHYQSLGVKHFIFLDTGSVDDTIQIAASHDNVTILKTSLPFKNNNMKMREYLTSRFAKGKWSLCVDIDEFFDYPHSNQVSLSRLLQYLNDHGFNTVKTQMLDMFPEKIIRDDIPTQFNRDEHCFYELQDIEKISWSPPYSSYESEKMIFHCGGVRKRLFGLDEVVLTKFSLLKDDGSVYRAPNIHWIREAKIADLTAIIYHYKFSHQFWERVDEAVRLEQYWRDSVEYKAYQDKLTGSEFVLKSDQSKKFSSAQELLESEFISAPDDYVKTFVEGCRDIILVTATYPRAQRLEYLKRQIDVFKLQNNIFWILVEDDDQTDPQVEELLRQSDISYVYLHSGLVRDMGNTPKNHAFNYIKNNRLKGVVYVADDDNFYDAKVFKEIRSVRRVGIMPVSGLGPESLERPIVEEGKITGWCAGWSERKYPVDWAAIPFSANMLDAISYPFINRRKGPGAYVDVDFTTVKAYHQRRELQSEYYEGESEFLEKVIGSEHELELLCKDCSECYVHYNHPLEQNGFDHSASGIAEIQ